MPAEVVRLMTVCDHTFILDLREGAVVLDLGANHGAFSMAIARYLSKSTMVLVEANPDLASVLGRGAESYSERQNRAYVLNAIAGWESRPSCDFHLSNCDEASSIHADLGSVWGLKDEQSRVQVPMVTIDEILDRYRLPRIDLLKMDVEGAEWDIFAAFTEKHFDRIEQITVEFHDFVRPADSPRTDAAIQKLRSLGYRLFVGSPDGGRTDCLFHKNPFLSDS